MAKAIINAQQMASPSKVHVVDVDANNHALIEVIAKSAATADLYVTTQAGAL